MLRPYIILLESFPQFPNRLRRARAGTSEQRAREQQEVSLAHSAHGAPFAALGERRRDGGITEHGDPLWIARDDRFERDLRRWRRDVAEDVARTGLGCQLVEVTAVADDDRRIVPDDERERGCRRRWRATGEAVERSEEHTSELQSLTNLVCRLLLEKKKQYKA